MYLTAYRKGDLVRLKNGDEIKLLSDGYMDKFIGKIVCDIDKYMLGLGKKIKYTTLMKSGYLVENARGVKNEPYK